MEEVLISTEVPHKILHFILFIIFFFVFEGGRCVCVCPFCAYCGRSVGNMFAKLTYITSRCQCILVTHL